MIPNQKTLVNKFIKKLNPPKILKSTIVHPTFPLLLLNPISFTNQILNKISQKRVYSLTHTSIITHTDYTSYTVGY